LNFFNMLRNYLRM